VIRVSVAADGTQANGTSYEAVISADGRYVVFNSSASNLVAGDTNGIADVFRKDLLTGEIIRLTVAGDGTQANNDAEALFVSRDGRYVSFLSDATNLVGGDTNGTGDIFLIDATLVANRAAVADGRFVDLRLGTGDGASVSVSWGDGIIDTLTATGGTVSFTHEFATTGTKAVMATVSQHGQSWSVPYLIDLATGAMVRNTALEATLSGSAGSDALDGDGLANLIIGNAGSDVLNGGAGADRMYGGVDSDVYYVDDAGDQVVEAAGGGAADAVYAGISYTLVAHVEHLTAIGSSAISLTDNDLNNAISGNAFANALFGKDGNDTLNGDAGNDALDGGVGLDMLAGGLGTDTLTGGAGQDVFMFTTKASMSNVDRILDFSVADDTIQLENAVFTKLKAGKLAKSAFWKGAKAHDKSDRVIYDSKKGYLYYDADGSGSKAKQVPVATLSKNLKMTHADFFVI
jgi:Ca2+-binding RTX toxin-like protein